MAINNRRYLTLGEAAELVGLSQITIRRRIADGTLKAQRLGTPRPGKSFRGLPIKIAAEDLEAAFTPIPAKRKTA